MTSVVETEVLDPSGSAEGNGANVKVVVDQKSKETGSTEPDGHPYGCSHYQRRCAYVSPCCKKIYACRLCHDENEAHEVDRRLVTEIICSLCSTRQPVARNCSKCGIEFGKYFCAICRLFDDKDLGQFHCNQCGICRIGGAENFFHCPKCNLCLGIAMKDLHKCMENRTHANCPVCLEDLHTSRADLMCLPCSHLTHKECWKNLLQSGNYSCPVCCQSMVDMSDQWKEMDNEISAVDMPEELKDVKVWVLCKDCHQVSETRFHVVGLRCCHCGSYNTCRTADENTTGHESSEPAQTNSLDNA